MVSVVRSQRSCETQLVQFFNDMVSNLDRALNRGHRQADVIVMDFAKAFDKVPHKRLHKLHFYGMRGSTDKWIASWLSERYQKIGVRWPSLRSSPDLWSHPRIGLRTGPFLDIHYRSSGQYQVIYASFCRRLCFIYRCIQLLIYPCDVQK